MTYRTVAFAVGVLLAGSAVAQTTDAGAAPDQAVLADAAPFEIMLSNFAFTPNPIRLEAGKTYRLTIVNQAHGGHNFTAPEFFAAASVAPDDAAKIVKGRIKFKGEESVTITLVPAAGTYELDCTIFTHSGRGMKGQIIVA